MIRFFEQELLECLGVDVHTGKITSVDKLTISLHVYDSLFDFLFSVCEMMAIGKEKRPFGDDYVDISKFLTQKCDSLLREFLKRMIKEEKTLIPMVDRILDKTEQHLRNILSGIEYQIYHQNVKDYSLAREILPYVGDISDTAAINHEFTELLFSQTNFQAVLKSKVHYCYVHHLLPSAVANFRRCLLPSTPLGQIIKIQNSGGFNDLFDISATFVVNPGLSLCTLLIEIKNNSKIFFEEVRLKIQVQGMESTSSQTEFLIDSFASSSSRKLKACFSKQDYSPVKACIKVSTKQMTSWQSENVAVGLEKLESLAATRDLFDKKQLSLGLDLSVDFLRFALPLDLSSLPGQTIRAFEEKLIFGSTIYEADSTQIIEMPLSLLNLKTCILVLDTKPRPVYLKERLADHWTKIKTILLQEKAATCYFLFPLVAPSSRCCAIILRYEKKDQTSAVRTQVVIYFLIRSLKATVNLL